MKVIDSQIEHNLAAEGYIRVSDNEGGARFVRGSDSVYVSGHMVIVRSNGFTRAFPEDRAKFLGVRMMEIQARRLPRSYNGEEDRTSYDIRKLSLPL